MMRQKSRTRSRIIKRLPGPVEDWSREPLRLRKIQISDFHQTIDASLALKILKLLLRMIADTTYNSLINLVEVLEAYDRAERQGRNISLEQVVNRKSSGAKPRSQNGISCTLMAPLLIQQLKRLGLKAHAIRYAATGHQFNEAGNRYAGVGHVAVAIPHMKNREPHFTLLDPGLQIPAPITFKVNSDSPDYFYRDKKCRVLKTNDRQFPYRFAIYEKQALKYQLSEFQNFDPNFDLLNPLVVTRDSLRTAADYRIKTHDQLGKNLAQIKISLPDQSIKLRYTKRGSRVEFKTSFDSLASLKSGRGAKVLNHTSEQLGLTRASVYRSLGIVLKHQDLILRELLAPSVRELLKGINRNHSIFK